MGLVHVPWCLVPVTVQPGPAPPRPVQCLGVCCDAFGALGTALQPLRAQQPVQLMSAVVSALHSLSIEATLEMVSGPTLSTSAGQHFVPGAARVSCFLLLTLPFQAPPSTLHFG